jgi:hypothetical protein
MNTWQNSIAVLFYRAYWLCFLFLLPGADVFSQAIGYYKGTNCTFNTAADVTNS